jgi:hypothetical protein
MARRFRRGSRREADDHGRSSELDQGIGIPQSAMVSAVRWTRRGLRSRKKFGTYCCSRTMQQLTKHGTGQAAVVAVSLQVRLVGAGLLGKFAKAGGEALAAPDWPFESFRRDSADLSRRFSSSTSGLYEYRLRFSHSISAHRRTALPLHSTRRLHTSTLSASHRATEP